MATCKNCFHYEACSGFKTTDLDKDVWHYCQIGIPEEIPDIDQRCDSFKDRKSWVEVVRCKDCKFWECGTCKLHSEEPDQYSVGLSVVMMGTDFCSYGERKDND